MIITENAQKYCWNMLAKRMGATVNIEKSSNRLNINGVYLYYQSPIDLNGNEKAIFINPCPSEYAKQLIMKAEDELDWFEVKQNLPEASSGLNLKSLPLLFCKKEFEDQVVEVLPNGSLVFNIDIIAIIFFMLSRWEESVVLERDNHNRFQSISSVAYKQKFLHRPIVDEFAIFFKEWFWSISPSWEPDDNSFQIQLSHDIDHPLAYRNINLFSKRVGRALIIERSMKNALECFQKFFFGVDPYESATYKLAELSEKYNHKSAFYFMAASKSKFDEGYSPSHKRMKRMINSLHERGHEIGFHPGYNTFDDASLFRKQKQELDKVMPISKYGGRQHYLRFDSKQTWRLWNDNKMIYDSSVGYADCEGFRCGTCHPFPVFDLESDKALKLVELPLIVMESTLYYYRQFNEDGVRQKILELAERCAFVKGTFSLLWHNTELGKPDSPRSLNYERILADLKELRDSSNV